MSILNTKNDFKPQFLFINNSAINKSKEVLKENMEKMQDCIDEVSRLFQRKLTDEEISLILKDKFDVVIDFLRKEINFPNAKEQAIFDLLGIDVTKAKRLLNTYHGYNENNYKINNGKVSIVDKAVKDLEERNTYYTKTIRQNMALSNAQRICKELNHAIDNEFVPNYENGSLYSSQQSTISKFIKTIGSGVTSKGLKGFEPNYNEILRL